MLQVLSSSLTKSMKQLSEDPKIRGAKKRLSLYIYDYRSVFQVPYTVSGRILL